jgi:hypothetical protein
VPANNIPIAMTDTEILSRMSEAGISVWPDRERRIGSARQVNPVKAWNTFAPDPRNPGNPIQVTCACLRTALVRTIEELRT